MITLSIDVTKIPRHRIIPKEKRDGTVAKYLGLKLVDKKDENWDGFVAIDITKAEREAGGKGEIVGNWRTVGGKPQSKAPERQQEPEGEDSIPF